MMYCIVATVIAYIVYYVLSSSIFILSHYPSLYATLKS